METNIKEKDEVATVSQDENNTGLAAEQEQTNRWWQIRESADAERISYWSGRWATEKASFNFISQEADKNKNVHLKTEFHDQTISTKQKDKIHSATVSAATGSASKEYSHRLFHQTMNAIVSKETKPEEAGTIATSVIDTLLACKPQDGIEGMLYSRILVLQEQAMQYARLAQTYNDQRMIDSVINRSVKLSRLQNETILTLLKYKRGGEQRVIVQHVNMNVSPGAQAVGINTTGGAGDNKKN